MKKIILLLFVYIVSSAAYAANSWLTDQLVAYYPFEYNTNDQSDYANHGIANGNISYTAGAVGRGLKLNGVNSVGGTRDPDYVLVPNTSSLQFHNQMTLSYWVKIDGRSRQTSENCTGDIVGGIYGSVIGKSGDRNGFSVSETEFTSDFGIDIFGGVGHKQTASKLASSAFGKFRFVTYVVSHNLTEVYIDGVLIRSEASNVDFSTANNEDMYIGVQRNGAGEGGCAQFWYPLDGVVDELRLYSRKLSATEIRVLYQCENLSVATCNSYQDIDKILEVATRKYSHLFEPRRETFAIIGYWAQYYPGTNTYLGSQNGRFYGYSIERWGGMIDFGSINDLLGEINSTGTVTLRGL